MKLFIVLHLLLLMKHALGEADSPNVKTVLFKESDLDRNCWNQRDTSLLVIRKVMQDLIPKHIPTSKSMPQLLAYLRSVEEAVDGFPPEDETNILIRLAVADVLGGYLQAIVIPMAKQGYYSGTIDYDTVNYLHEMVDDMKLKLGTDGGGWPHAIDPRKFGLEVSTLEFEGSTSAACRGLVVLDVCPLDGSRIAMPYFDDNRNPTAVALPLNGRNLYPLKHASSSNIFLKYYTLSMKCLKNFTDTDIINFNRKYHTWMTDKLYPHLYEQDRWYAGFSGVLRILETMKQRGLTSPIYPGTVLGNNVTDLEKSLKNYPCGGAPTGDSYVFIIFMLLLIFFLLLLFCCYCCIICALKRKKMKNKNMSEDSNADAMVSLYCGVKNVNQTTKDTDEYEEDEKNRRLSSLFSKNQSDSEKRVYTRSSVFEETRYQNAPKTSPYTVSLDRSETDDFDDEGGESDISSI